MTAGVAVRAAEPDDAERFAAVCRNAYADTAALGFPMKGAETTTEEAATWIERDRVLVAERDGEVIGGVRLSTETGEAIKLGRLAVHETANGGGIGTALLDRAEAVAAEAGHDAIRLTTPPDHPFLADLYRDRGYQNVGDHPLDYREYDEILLEKRVGKSALRD